MTSTDEIDAIATLRKNKVMKKWLFLSAILIFVMAVTLVAITWPPKFNGQSTNILPSGTVSRTDFHIYYPDTIPEDMSLDEKSVSYSNEVFFYTLRSNTDSSYITVSQQKAPASQNAESILRRPDRAPEQLSIGTLYDIGSSAGTNFAISTSEKSIVYINPSKSSDISTVKKVINSLR